MSRLSVFAFGELRKPDLNGVGGKKQFTRSMNCVPIALVCRIATVCGDIVMEYIRGWKWFFLLFSSLFLLFLCPFLLFSSLKEKAVEKRRLTEEEPGIRTTSELPKRTRQTPRKGPIRVIPPF